MTDQEQADAVLRGLAGSFFVGDRVHWSANWAMADSGIRGWKIHASVIDVRVPGEKYLLRVRARLNDPKLFAETFFARHSEMRLAYD